MTEPKFTDTNFLTFRKNTTLGKAFENMMTMQAKDNWHLFIDQGAGQFSSIGIWELHKLLDDLDHEGFIQALNNLELGNLPGLIETRAIDEGQAEELTFTRLEELSKQEPSGVLIILGEQGPKYRSWSPVRSSSESSFVDRIIHITTSGVMLSEKDVADIKDVEIGSVGLGIPFDHGLELDLGEIELALEHEEHKRVEEEIEEESEVDFSVYYPETLKPNTNSKILAYVHLPSVFDQIKDDSKEILGDEAEDFGVGAGDETASLTKGTKILVKPHLPGYIFEPSEAIITWRKDWHRVVFDMEPDPDQPTTSSYTKGWVNFYVAGIEIANVRLRVEVSESFQDAKERKRATRSAHQIIFISYSHKNDIVVRQAEIFEKARGSKVLRDAVELRSGEDWNQKIHEWIDTSDIFQLFWSQEAKDSKYVEEEWLHALEIQREGFIRPVYWEKPLVDPPEQLGRLEFAYLDLEEIEKLINQE